MGRRRRSVSPPGARFTAGFRDSRSSSRSPASSAAESRLSWLALQPLLARIWLPICFAGINAVCYAIEPSTGALMMTSSAFLLHQMGVAGRGLTAFIVLLALGALLLQGSDVVYIMAVHTLYYCAVSLGKGNPRESIRTKRPYAKKSGY